MRQESFYLDNMKIKCSTIINVPLERVLELFLDVNSLKFWQEGLVSYELLNGELWHKGARSKIVYKTKRGNIELIETVQINELPGEMTALYEHLHGSNTMTSRFNRLDENTTAFVLEVEPVEIKGFVPKVMLKLMPGMPRKGTQKMVDDFKRFAESKK